MDPKSLLGRKTGNESSGNIHTGKKSWSGKRRLWAQMKTSSCKIPQYTPHMYTAIPLLRPTEHLRRLPCSLIVCQALCFSDITPNWRQTGKHRKPQFIREAGMQEKKPLLELVRCRWWSAGGSLWTSWELKTPRGLTQYSGSPHAFRHSKWRLTEEWGSRREDERKISLMLWQGERELFFTHFETWPKYSILLNKTCPQEKQSEPNLLGFY